MPYIVVALYHFFDFPEHAKRRQEIREVFLSLAIKGTLLVTPEGVNGTLAGSRDSIDKVLVYLRDKVIGQVFDYKESQTDIQPFKRTKVKIKKETISIGEPAPLHARGTYVEAEEWNALISDPDTVVIDTRNGYEVELGTFAHAIDPGIRNFKQLPAIMRERFPDKSKKIASFCTGGIRCEKFTAWLAGQGYEEVYHLKGGILKYLEDMPKEQSLWKGDCFVFDERVAVDHDLSPSEEKEVH